MVDVPPDRLPEIQQLSKHLLGNGYRLQVAAAIHDCPPEELYPDGIAARCGLKEARVGEQLRHFALAGMLTALKRDGRKQPYQRRSSVYWRACNELLEELIG